MDDKRQHGNAPVPPAGGDREAIDANDVQQLQADPGDRDGRLDIGVDESFPASDPPSQTQPRKGTDGPPPGGKYD